MLHGVFVEPFELNFGLFGELDCLLQLASETGLSGFQAFGVAVCELTKVVHPLLGLECLCSAGFVDRLQGLHRVVLLVVPEVVGDVLEHLNRGGLTRLTSSKRVVRASDLLVLKS